MHIRLKGSRFTGEAFLASAEQVGGQIIFGYVLNPKPETEKSDFQVVMTEEDLDTLKDKLGDLSHRIKEQRQGPGIPSNLSIPANATVVPGRGQFRQDGEQGTPADALRRAEMLNPEGDE